MIQKKYESRGEIAHQACMNAALEILAKEGYKALTIEAIAKATGVAKTTIYRRWSSKGELVLDAFLHTGERGIIPSDSGCFRQDLASFVKQTFNVVSHGLGNSLVSLIVEAQIDSNFAKLFYQRLIENRRQVLREIIQRGVERGDLRKEIDVETTLDLIYGPFWYRLLVKHGPLDDAYAEILVEQVFRGVER